MAEFTTWRVFDGLGDPLPGAVPAFLKFCDRTGLDLTPQPGIVNLGNGLFGFAPSAAHAGLGVAYLVDNGAAASPRYVNGTVNAQGVVPFASFNFLNPDTTLFNGAGLPSFVGAGAYVSNAGVPRAPPAVVPLLANHLFAVSPSQADLDAGGAVYVLTAAAGAEPSSFDGSFSAETEWNYDADLADAISKVRLLIGDTDPNDRLLLDDEIAFFLSEQSDNIYLAAAACCRAIAAKFSRQADFTNLSLSVSASQRAKAYLEMATELEAKSASLVGAEMFVGGITKSGKQELANDTNAVQPSFNRGQDDLPGNDDQAVRPWWEE